MQTEIEFEICVGCGEKTDVPRSEPVEMRRTYVEGAGQLCPCCWRNCYVPCVTQYDGE